MRKTTKQMLSLFLALVVVLGLLPVSVGAAEVGEVVYSEDFNDTLGWNAEGSVKRVTFDDADCLHMEDGGVIRSGLIPAQPNVRYTLSYAAQGDVTGSYAIVTFYAEDGTTDVDTVDAYLNRGGQGTWQDNTFPVVCVEPATAYMEVSIFAGETGANFYLKDLKLFRLVELEDGAMDLPIAVAEENSTEAWTSVGKDGATCTDGLGAFSDGATIGGTTYTEPLLEISGASANNWNWNAQILVPAIVGRTYEFSVDTRVVGGSYYIQMESFDAEMNSLDERAKSKAFEASDFTTRTHTFTPENEDVAYVMISIVSGVSGQLGTVGFIKQPKLKMTGGLGEGPNLLPKAGDAKWVGGNYAAGEDGAALHVSGTAASPVVAEKPGIYTISFDYKANGTVSVNGEKFSAADWTSVSFKTELTDVLTVESADADIDNVVVTVVHIHDYEAVVTAPAYHEKGYTTYTCSCGKSYVDDPVDALIYAASVNDEKFETLAEAVAAAETDETVVLLCDVPGAGVVIDKSISIDLNEYTYTFNKAVGSAGTETLGLQILKDNNVTIKNGTLTSTDVVEGKEVKVLIQNYADLTLTDVKLVDATDHIQYALSNNSGNVSLDCETSITTDEVAFDAYDYSAGGYTPPVVSVNTTGTIEGKIEVSETAKLAVSGGTFTVPLEKSWYAEGYGPSDNEDGTYTVHKHVEETLPSVEADCDDTGKTEGAKCSVCDEILTPQEEISAKGHTNSEAVKENEVAATYTTPGSYDAVVYCSVCGAEVSRSHITVDPLTGFVSVNDEKFETLAEAVAAAEEGETIVLLCDATGAGATIDKSVIIDLGGYTYTFNKAVGSAGTETLGLQIFKDNDVTIKNGTLTSENVEEGKEVKMLIQNYANLTLTDVKLVDATEHIQYALSNNSGEVVLDGDTSITTDAVAFDVYDYSSAGYPLPNVSVNTTGTIEGTIVVSKTAKLAVSGGTFTVALDKAWYAEGCGSKDNANGTHTVHKHVEESIPAVEADCDDTGLTEGTKCSVCDEVLVEQEVVLEKGHTPGEVVVENNVEPTYTTAGSYDKVVYCSVCNTELSRSTVDVPALVPSGTIKDNGRSLSLDGVIYINQYVKITGFEGVNVAANGGLLIWKTPVTEEEATVDNAAATNVKGLIVGNGEYGVQTPGIAAKEYADELYLRVYVKDNAGNYTYGPLVEYSVQDYCQNKLKKTETDAKKQLLQEVCAHMLHYGAAAQVNFSYNLEDLANDCEYMENYPADPWNANLLTPLAEINTQFQGDAAIKDNGKSLSLSGAVLVNFYFKPTSADWTAASADLLVWDSVTDALTLENVTYTVSMKNNGTEWGAQSRMFAAKEYGKTIFACAKVTDTNGEDHYSNIVNYSPEYYAANQIKKNTKPNLVATVKAMVTYGDYAAQYFAK